MGPSVVRWNRSVTEILRFSAVGLLATALYFALAIVIVAVTNLNVLATSIWAYLIATIFSFFAHRSFTFRKTGNMKIQGMRFLLNTFLGLVIATTAPVLLSDSQPAIIFGVVCVAIPVLSFVIQKLFVFKD